MMGVDRIAENMLCTPATEIRDLAEAMQSKRSIRTYRKQRIQMNAIENLNIKCDRVPERHLARAFSWRTRNARKNNENTPSPVGGRAF